MVSPRRRVSVLAAVSTQFIMMLNSPEIQGADLSSLRVLFTGGEAVPYERAAAFEDRTGARVLQFYGSNETGARSRTTLRDDRDVRNCVDYLHWNPLKHGLVDRLVDWPWSSFHRFVRSGDYPSDWAGDEGRRNLALPE